MQALTLFNILNKKNPCNTELIQRGFWFAWGALHNLKCSNHKENGKKKTRTADLDSQI